ncbi:MAG: sensor histidine kinase [Candidatus Margulisiibacteriota bacterium]
MADKRQDVPEKLSLGIHPRVFEALGSDLVTNDVVAIIELVKNSYDAFASNVYVRFKNDSEKGDYIEIEDDGLGMTKEIIQEAWCVVATPFRENNPFSKVGKKQRRVVGEKGLGRLSMARIGNQLQMLTQYENNPCWEIRLNWEELSQNKTISSSTIDCLKYKNESPFKKSGTILRIYDLNEKWDDSKVDDLKDNMSRLVSPFSKTSDFHVYFGSQNDKNPQPVEILAPEFIRQPKYSIAGKVDNKGRIKALYKYFPVRDGKPRSTTLEHSWEQTFGAINDKTRYPFSPKEFHCGEFQFEIRAWDIGSDDTQEITDKYGIKKAKIRQAIRVHKGISVYRDEILVLPKSETARDWLGLDLRRISLLGRRLSTSQIVGYVDLSADNNPDIKDTSDRERLVSNLAVGEFEETLMEIVRLLETEREIDKDKREKIEPFKNLFDEISADKLVAEVSALEKEGANISEVLPAVESHNAQLEKTKIAIQERFVYYSRLATVGTIAQMLVHEIRNRTTALGALLAHVKEIASLAKDALFMQKYTLADDSVNSLERLADTFAPLASRGFRRRMRHSILEERILACIDLQKGELESKEIDFELPKTGQTKVAVDPGELDAILLNLIANSIYWLGQIKDRKRRIRVVWKHLSSSNQRMLISVEDNGPGIPEEDREFVFLPGHTKKPGGIGMGLTVASEIVAEYGGKMYNESNSSKMGIAFSFDVPLTT